MELGILTYNMKNIFIILTCLMFFIGMGKTASALTYVVHKPDDLPCTSSEMGYYTTIQSAVDASYNYMWWWADVIVCPGTYEENVYVGRGEIAIMSHSQNPLDTTVQAADNSRNVFQITTHLTLDGPRISGFTIQGATGDSPCNDDMEQHNEGPRQPCAGIRVYCDRDGSINNNIITGNNYGVIIKDTVPEWPFRYNIQGNKIYANNVGIKLHYGHYSIIRDNHIYNNSTGVEFIDTWGNEIFGNTFSSNDLGMELMSVQYPAGEATKGNKIYHNNFISNTVQASDDAACPTGGYEHYWYETTLLEGNYWSDYSGVDDGSGTGKHAIASDNIGDTLIPHPAECYDDYPYMFSYGWLCSSLPVSIDGTALEYYTFQDAYDNASDGNTIKSRDIYFPEDFSVNRNISISIQGGYNCDYTGNISKTIIAGNMSISDGTVTIQSGTLEVI